MSCERRDSGILGKMGWFGVVAVTCLTGWGCATVQDLVNVRAPTAQITGSRISGLDFNAIDLEMDVQVTNPNPVGLSLAGVNYSLAINEQEFVSGDMDQGLRLTAQESRSVAVPVSLRMGDLLNLADSVRGRDTLPYRFVSDLRFQAPVLGVQTIPVNFTGEIPILRPPSIRLEGIRKDSLGLRGAELTLRLAVTNPNAIPFVIEGFDYAFKVDGKSWAKAQSAQSTTLTEKGESVFEIPVSLSFFRMGRAVHQILQGEQGAEYELTGQMALQAPFKGLKPIRLPVNAQGRLSYL